jgi:transposase, IS5 family
MLTSARRVQGDQAEHMSITAEPPKSPVTEGVRSLEVRWIFPGKLADALLDDPVFFASFAPYFHPVLGRPSTPIECYLRLMFLKFRYRLGYESLRAEVSDSISWRRFCRIGLDAKVPHPTTLMKLTTRCGEMAVAGLNEALLARAAGQKLLRTGGYGPIPR